MQQQRRPGLTGYKGKLVCSLLLSEMHRLRWEAGLPPPRLNPPHSDDGLPPLELPQASSLLHSLTKTETQPSSMQHWEKAQSSTQTAQETQHHVPTITLFLRFYTLLEEVDIQIDAKKNDTLFRKKKFNLRCGVAVAAKMAKNGLKMAQNGQTITCIIFA